MVTKGYKVRLYPNKWQLELILKTFDCTRFVYNKILDIRQTEYKVNHKSLSDYDCVKLLPGLKGTYPWLKEVDSTALQASVLNLGDAYKNFYAHRGKFPRFKRRHKNRGSFTSKMNIDANDHAVKLPKLGWVKAKISTPIKGEIKHITVSITRTGKIFASICCQGVEIDQYQSTGNIIGIDMGVRNLITTSTGMKYDPCKPFATAQKKIARLQRRLSRKPKGSHNHEKARHRLAVAIEKVNNQRLDTLHKVSTTLVKENDIIGIESLNVAGMLKNHHLAKSIQDAAFGEFTRMLKYKAEWQHKQVVEIDTFFPSTQRCSTCGFVNTDLKGIKNLGKEKWVCPKCNSHHDRDINAAINIREEAIRLLTA